MLTFYCLIIMKSSFLISMLLLIGVACSQQQLPLVTTIALKGNITLAIPSMWRNHQLLKGWASDCKGCSYSEPGDYFGEDSLQMVPMTPPKRSFCTVSSKISPGGFRRSLPFKPDVISELKVLKQKDPSARKEKISVSLVDRKIDVSYESSSLETQSALFCRSITYSGPNRKVMVFFKGKDTPAFREIVDAVCKSIQIKPAFLNEQIDE